MNAWKVLTLHQPWASLVVLGVKRIETRSWSTKYRGPLAIHAAARKPSQSLRVGNYYVDWGLHPGHSGLTSGEQNEGVGFLLVDGGQAKFEDDLSRPLANAAFIPLPLGAIVATATLVDVVPIVDADYGAPGADDRYVIDNTDEGNLYYRRAWGVYEYVEEQRPYGDFTAGRYAYLLADVVSLNPPVPFKGGQGFTKTWIP